MGAALREAMRFEPLTRRASSMRNGRRLNLNSVTGTLPTELFQCTGLKTLDLRRTLLTGPIPTEIGDATDLSLM